ncbi:hypothetical protein KJ855_01095 [Patescibacteria group bacterium]|nr:hypothetical protein [Patescibacteria group bacterium]
MDANFVDEIIADMGLDHLSEDELKGLKYKVGDALEKKVMADVTGELKEEHKETVGKMLGERKDIIAIINYIYENVPELMGKVEKSMREFRQELMA